MALREDKTASLCNSTADLQSMVEQQMQKQGGDDLFEEVSGSVPRCFNLAST